MTEEEFLQEMEVMGYTDVVGLPDGKWAGAIPRLFAWDVVKGNIGDLSGWDEQWTFESHVNARLGILMLVLGEPEPEGWIRHIPSNRRRPSGDKSQERIAP